MVQPESSFIEDSDTATEAAALKAAEADVASGRVISHDAMLAWLRSWGMPDELPPPECGA
jgi:predicted transcriptional regulator